MKWLLIPVLALLALVVLAGPAYAHTAALSGSQACLEGDQRSVTWTLDTAKFTGGTTANFSSPSGGFDTPTKTFASPASVKDTQLLPGATTGTVTATAHVVWSDGFTVDATASVTLGDPCVTTTTSTVPTTTTVPDTTPTTTPPTTDTTVVETNVPGELPRTGSSLGWVALGGFFLLGLGVSLCLLLRAER